MFIEKGYERTSIQDIINNLGGLSKGAIYHHFKSKEEIFDAVCASIGEENMAYYNAMRDDKTQNGYQKLKSILKSAYANPNNEAVLAMTSKILSDAKFMMELIMESFELVAPQYIEPVIRQGIADGSLKTDYPKELAEVIIALLNVWVNPLIARATPDEMRRKVEFFDILLKGIGVDIIDAEIIEQYVIYCARYSA